MAVAASSGPRASVDGKFFRLGEKKFYVKGVAYGPFASNAAGQPFASPEQTASDFDQIRELNANLTNVFDGVVANPTPDPPYVLLYTRVAWPRDGIGRTLCRRPRPPPCCR